MRQSLNLACFTGQCLPRRRHHGWHSSLTTPEPDDFSGAVTATLPQIGGSDEAWHDPGNKTYFLAWRYATGGSKLGVIDARTNAFLGSVPIGKGSHSVATDPYNNHVFVPLPASPADLECPNGCVGVYGLPE